MGVRDRCGHGHEDPPPLYNNATTPNHNAATTSSWLQINKRSSALCIWSRSHYLSSTIIAPCRLRVCLNLSFVHSRQISRANLDAMERRACNSRPNRWVAVTFIFAVGTICALILSSRMPTSSTTKQGRRLQATPHVFKEKFLGTLSPTVERYPLYLRNTMEVLPSSMPLKGGQTDLVFYWTIPKSGSVAVKSIMARCFGLRRAEKVKEPTVSSVIDCDTARCICCTRVFICAI